jgi:hypothetical protein
VFAVRRDADTSLVGTDGDYAPLQVNAGGQLKVEVFSGETLPVSVSGVATAANQSTANTALAAIETAVEGVLRTGKVFAQRTGTFSLDTSAYAASDLLADTQQINAFFNVADGTGFIHTLTLYDQDDQKVPMTIYFHNTTASMGSENAAPSISDANALGILGWVDIIAADWKDLGGVAVATVVVNLPVTAVSGTDDLYISAVNSTGTPTFTASGIKFSIGVELSA